MYISNSERFDTPHKQPAGALELIIPHAEPTGVSIDSPLPLLPKNVLMCVNWTQMQNSVIYFNGNEIYSIIEPLTCKICYFTN